MKYELINKLTNERVTLVDSNTFGLNEARFYFRRIKRLEEPAFSKMYEVKECNKKIKVSKQIEWWKDEATDLDYP